VATIVPVRRIRLTVPAALLALLGSLAFAAPARAELPAPTDLHQVASSPTSVKVSWTADPAATRFRISYATKSDFSDRGTNKETTSTTYTITGLTASTSYYVRVRIISDDGTVPLSAWSESLPGVKTAQSLRVASFNIKMQTNSGSCQSWTTRRPAVVRDILTENIDIVGLQEAIDDNRRQGLVDAVNADGAHYAMTYSPTDDTGAGNRLLYNTDRVELLNTPGDFIFTRQEDGDKRQVIWGWFRFKANQQKFVFFTTHLAPGGGESLTKSQWGQVLSLAKARGADGKVPTIVTGDFNTSKFNKPADTMLSEMYDQGFGDVLGQTANSYRVSHQRAEIRTNAWINSFNDCDRDVGGVDRDDIGNNIDWIFASNNLSVPKWKTVANRDGLTLNTPIASDHFMITAKILIPLIPAP